MKTLTALFAFLVLFCAFASGFTKLEKLSTDDALSLLKLMDEIENTSNSTHLKQTFKELTDHDYDTTLKSKLYEIIDNNANHTSIFMRLMGLITFQNFILVCIVIVCVALVVSLFRDVIRVLGEYMTVLIVQLILDKRFMYTVGLSFSVVMMYIDPSKIENQYLKYVFILDWLSPLFGCLIFGIIAFVMYNDLVDKRSQGFSRHHTTHHGGYSEKNMYMPIGFIVTLVWMVVTVYHQNWLIGIVTIMMLFFTFGFLFGAVFGGYEVGFVDTMSMMRCFIISFILNACMVGMQTGFIKGDVVQYFNIFETGIYFWGTFVGSLAMLIMSDEWFIKMNSREKENEPIYFMLMQVLMGLYCLGMMYLGSVLHITTFKSIVGTFFVLWSLDLEKTILKKFGKGHLSITLMIILANLYAVYKLISWYPEYCIFGFSS